jgi:hypothetical protein
MTTEPQTDPQTQLLDALEHALAEGRFVKLSLGKGRSGHRHAHVRLVEIPTSPCSSAATGPLTTPRTTRWPTPAR